MLLKFRFRCWGYFCSRNWISWFELYDKVYRVENSNGWSLFQAFLDGTNEISSAITIQFRRLISIVWKNMTQLGVKNNVIVFHGFQMNFVFRQYFNFDYLHTVQNVWTICSLHNWMSIFTELGFINITHRYKRGFTLYNKSNFIAKSICLLTTLA